MFLKVSLDVKTPWLIEKIGVLGVKECHSLSRGDFLFSLLFPGYNQILLFRRWRFFPKKKISFHAIRKFIRDVIRGSKQRRSVLYFFITCDYFSILFLDNMWLFFQVSDIGVTLLRSINSYQVVYLFVIFIPVFCCRSV